MKKQPKGVTHVRSVGSVAGSAGNVRVDGALRLARRFAKDAGLPLEGWKRIIQATQLNEHEAKVLLRAAESSGLRVLDPRSEARPAASSSDAGGIRQRAMRAPGISTIEENLPSASVPPRGTSEVGPSVAEKEVTTAAAVALRLLEDDRRSTRPWKKILTAEEEVGLAELMRGGGRLDTELPASFPVGLEPDSLPRRAWDSMMLHNLRLVHDLARKHALPEGMEHDDLVQYGVFGLARAIRKFNALQGYKFSTYATWWLKQTMSRAIADYGSLIRIPVHMHETCQKVRSTQQALFERGLPAGPGDIALATHLSPSKVEEALRISKVTASLDVLVGDGATLGDFLASTESTPSTEFIVLTQLEREQAHGLLDRLPERLAEVLRLRFGLYDGEEWTLERIGDRLGFTREWARQLEVKALSQLRKSAYGKKSEQPRKEPIGDPKTKGRPNRKATEKDVAVTASRLHIEGAIQRASHTSQGSLHLAALSTIAHSLRSMGVSTAISDQGDRLELKVISPRGAVEVTGGRVYIVGNEVIWGRTRHGFSSATLPTAAERIAAQVESFVTKSITRQFR